MKQLILFTAILYSSFCFSQNSPSIIGIVLDQESFNEPLMYANVSIEGTTLESFSDENGLFHFENLSEGSYTLVISFVGYETKELNVQIASNQATNISVTLIARTMSLAELTSLNKVE